MYYGKLIGNARLRKGAVEWDLPCCYTAHACWPSHLLTRTSLPVNVDCHAPVGKQYCPGHQVHGYLYRHACGKDASVLSVQKYRDSLLSAVGLCNFFFEREQECLYWERLASHCDCGTLCQDINYRSLHYGTKMRGRRICTSEWWWEKGLVTNERLSQMSSLRSRVSS
jgi:hypothetical protein